MDCKLTIATFLPKWFLISPSLTASGACSLMITESSMKCKQDATLIHDVGGDTHV